VRKWLIGATFIIVSAVAGLVFGLALTPLILFYWS